MKIAKFLVKYHESLDQVGASGDMQSVLIQCVKFQMSTIYLSEKINDGRI